MKLHPVHFRQIVFFVLSLTLFTEVPNVFAHVVADEPWLFINGEPAALSKTPNPSALPWAEHSGHRAFAPDEDVSFAVSLPTLDLTEKDGTVSWEFPDETLKGTVVSYAFPDTSNIFITVQVDVGGSKPWVRARETFAVIVGSPPEAGTILVDGAEATSVAIDRNDVYEFAVATPQDALHYIWDLADGDTHDTYSVRKQFSTTSMPAYAVLRTTDPSTSLYSDSAVKLTSTQPPTFSVNRPPPPTPQRTALGQSLGDTIGKSGAIVIASSILLIVLFLFGRKP